MERKDEISECTNIGIHTKWRGEGHLLVVEGEKDIPFDIKRVVYIYGSDSKMIRGQYANKKSEFVLINVSVQCNVKDGKGNEADFLPYRTHNGIYLPLMI